jgi:hypothetical protein
MRHQSSHIVLEIFYGALVNVNDLFGANKIGGEDIPLVQQRKYQLV